MVWGEELEKCFYCSEEVGEKDRFYLGLDIPYINIPFHKNCFRGIEDINVFLQGKVEEIYTLLSKNSEKIMKNRRK